MVNFSNNLGALTMAICASCGFDGFQEGSACRVCGSSEQSATIMHEGPPSFDEPFIVSGTPSKSSAKRFEIPKGEYIEKKYLVQKMIGRGGMGSVYEVQD